jgi:acyl carrier protein phosphodiesterase
VNWLAHVLLSEDHIEFRMGNLLADLVKGRERKAMPVEFLRGVKQHQKIDAFTDSHPIVHKSISRIHDEYRRFAGILVDVFYDHFLALHWDRYVPVPLEAFTAGLYADIQAYPIALSNDVQWAVDRLIADDRLSLYQHIHGIEDTLQRISARIASRVGRDFALQGAITQLTENYDELADDFARFFPLLQAHVGLAESML